MPEGKELPIIKGEYPELDDLKDGSPLKIRAEAEIEWFGGKQGVIRFLTFDIETENAATKAYNEMRKQPYSMESQESGNEEDTF